MHRHARMLTVALALAVAGPAFSADRAGDAAADVKDTGDQAAHDARRAVRQHKPGGESLGDKAKDAQDAARSKAAKGRKKARHARRHASQAAKDATR